MGQGYGLFTDLYSIMLHNLESHLLTSKFLKSLMKKEKLSLAYRCWFGTLECVHIKVSGSIPLGVNFGDIGDTKICSTFKRDFHKCTLRYDP